MVAKIINKIFVVKKKWYLDVAPNGCGLNHGS